MILALLRWVSCTTRGSSAAGPQTFQNTTNLHTMAWGGSGPNVFISSGTGQDDFYGGSGSNTFYAGSGFDEFIGGTGPNVYNESTTGSGVIFEEGSSNTIASTAGSTGTYQIYG